MPSIPSHFTKDQVDKRRAGNRETMRKWRLANPEKANERNRRYRLDHREDWIASYRLAGAKYRAKDPVKYKALKHAEQLRNKARKQRYTKEHSAEAKVRLKKWVRANPERHRIHKINAKARRRVRELTNGEVASCVDKITLLKRERFCHWCCTPLTKENLEIDHVVPICRGGTHTPDNLVAACAECNQLKGGKLLSEWTWKEAA